LTLRKFGGNIILVDEFNGSPEGICDTRGFTCRCNKMFCSAQSGTYRTSCKWKTSMRGPSRIHGVESRVEAPTLLQLLHCIASLLDSTIWYKHLIHGHCSTTGPAHAGGEPIVNSFCRLAWHQEHMSFTLVSDWRIKDQPLRKIGTTTETHFCRKQIAAVNAFHNRVWVEVGISS